MDTTRWVVVALVTLAALGPAGVGTATAAEDCSFPLTRTDATGESVTVPADPATVVTLGPSAAQTTYEIGAWDEVVGVTTFASYLPGADEKATVGNGNTDAAVEQTLALDPDLVLAPNTIDDTTVAQLRGGGLTVYKFEAAEDLADIEAKTRLTGDLVGACEQADSRADEMDRQLDVIEGAVDDVERPRVFYTFFGFTAGEDTFVHEVIETAGGDNVAADDPGINANGASTSGFFDASASVVVSAEPQWFVLNSDEYDEATVPSGPGGVYEGTPAHEAGNAVVLDANEISQPAPRIVDAILDLVQALHPEAYEEEIQGQIDESLGGERRATAERLADGRTTLRAANLGREDRVRFDLPPRSNATAGVRRVTVALSTVNPTFELDLRYGVERPAPNGTRALETVALSGNGIFPADVDHLTLRLAVNRSRLDGVDPDTVSLYRATDAGWTPLQTTRVNATATNASQDTLVYEARTTDMSTLMLAAAAPDAGAPAANATPPATATATAAPTATATPTATTPPTDTPPSTSGQGPGFGPLAATAALATALAGARWRR
jgi:putative ABC transporter PGF-CTERM-modified substrate-binding protein